MKSSKKSERKSEMYKSIDKLPILIWLDIHETSDLTLLFIKQPKKINFKALEDAWEKINDEYLQCFGISEEMETTLENKRLAALAKCEYLITGERHHLTFAEIHEESAKIETKKIKVDIENNLAKLTKFYGVRLRSNELTVREYYNFIKEATNGGN